ICEPIACPETVTLGYDSEYVNAGSLVRIDDLDVEWPELSSANVILSYQFAMRLPSGMLIQYVLLNYGTKLSLAELIITFFDTLRALKIVRGLPRHVELVAHFSRADLHALSDYRKILEHPATLTVRKTHFINDTSDNALYANGYDCRRNKFSIKVSLRDTMLLAPGGSSLAALGDACG